MRPIPILLDTCILESQRFDFGNKRFSRLTELAGFKTCELLTHYAIELEVADHMRDHAVKARASVKKASNAVVGALDPSEMGLLSPGDIPQPDDIFRSMLERYRAFKEKCSSFAIPAEHGSLKQVVELYFAGEPPFKTAKSNGLIDAAALTSVERWAQVSGREVVLVSNDSHWKQFNSVCKYSILFDDIDILIEYIVKQFGLKAFGGDRNAWSDYVFGKAKESTPLESPVQVSERASEASTDLEKQPETFGDILEEIREGKLELVRSSRGAKRKRGTPSNRGRDTVISQFPNRLALYDQIRKSPSYRQITTECDTRWPEESIFYLSLLADPISKGERAFPLHLNSSECIENWDLFIQSTTEIMSLAPTTSSSNTNRSLQTIYQMRLSSLERIDFLELVEATSLRSHG